MKHKLFTSVFNGEESFLTDHKIGGLKVLPGAIYLELVRIAGEYAMEESVKVIKNVEWLHPIVFMNDSSKEVHVELHEKDNQVNFKVFTEAKTVEIIHCKGEIEVSNNSPVKLYALDKLKSDFSQHKDKASCYALFSSFGLDYGSTFQGIDELYYNSEASLSRISLPINKDYILSPEVIDSALQTCIGVQLGQNEVKESCLSL